MQKAEKNMELTAEEFLKEVGLEEGLNPGEIKYIKRPGEKEGNSYTIVYDWKTDEKKICVEVRPGLTGHWPDEKELRKYAVWLQTKNKVEFEVTNDLSHAE